MATPPKRPRIVSASPASSRNYLPLSLAPFHRNSFDTIMMATPPKRPRIVSASPASSSRMELSSSSSFSKCAKFSEFPLLSRSVESLWAEECVNIKRYDLYHLLKLNPEEASKSSSSSEVLCSSFFEEVVKGMNVVITVKKKVPQFANLYQLYCSTDQRPDLNLSREEDDLPLILVEVHSSPFAETVNFV